MSNEQCPICPILLPGQPEQWALIGNIGGQPAKVGEIRSCVGCAAALDRIDEDWLAWVAEEVERQQAARMCPFCKFFGEKALPIGKDTKVGEVPACEHCTTVISHTKTEREMLIVLQRYPGELTPNQAAQIWIDDPIWKDAKQRVQQEVTKSL